MRTDPRDRSHSYLSTARISRNLTSQQLADQIGSSRKSVSRWENGSSVPRLSMLIRLSDVLGCPLDELTNSFMPLKK